jgi:hypothetical protein
MTNQTKTIDKYRIWWSSAYLIADIKGKPASSCAWDFEESKWQHESRKSVHVFYTGDYEAALDVFNQEFELEKEKETPFKMTLAKEVCLFIYDKDDDEWIFDSSETTPLITALSAGQKTHKD